MSQVLSNTHKRMVKQKPWTRS